MGSATGLRPCASKEIRCCPPCRKGHYVAVHHDDRKIQSGDLYFLYDLEKETAVVKRLMATNWEGEFLLESDNPDKKQFPTKIWKKDLPDDSQFYRMIGSVICAWTLFKYSSNTEAI